MPLKPAGSVSPTSPAGSPPARKDATLLDEPAATQPSPLVPVQWPPAPVKNRASKERAATSAGCIEASTIDGRSRPPTGARSRSASLVPTRAIWDEAHAWLVGSTVPLRSWQLPAVVDAIAACTAPPDAMPARCRVSVPPEPLRVFEAADDAGTDTLNGPVGVAVAGSMSAAAVVTPCTVDVPSTLVPDSTAFDSADVVCSTPICDVKFVKMSDADENVRPAIAGWELSARVMVMPPVVRLEEPYRNGWHGPAYGWLVTPLHPAG